MLETLILAVFALMLLFALVALPLLIIGALVKALLFLILLPFKLLKALLGLIGGIALGLGKIFFALLALLFGGLIAVGAVLVLPVLGLLVAVGLIWLLVRRFRSDPTPTPVAPR